MDSLPTEIIHIGVNRWDSMIQREQHLILGLSQFYRVLFVDPPLSFLTLSLEKMEGKKRTFRSRLRQVNDRLTVYTPPAYPPFSQKISPIHRWNTRLLASQVKTLAQRLSFKNYILGVSWPLSVGMLRELKPRWSYYDCSDNYPTYPGLKADQKKLFHSEEELLRSVNLVFCSARGLAEVKAAYNPHCFFIPNGVDPSFLLTGEKEVPRDLKSMRKPILGYMGTIGEWVDFDALTGLARARPEWSIVLIGPLVANRLASVLARVPNLHWLGEKRYGELPAYLRQFDVCLIPFKMNAFTEKIHPTKFHQYLGAGKPVVSSDLPDLKPFSPWVMFYRSLSEMEERVGEALRDDSGEKASERRRIAGENTWDQRVKTIKGIFDKYLNQ